MAGAPDIMAQQVCPHVSLGPNWLRPVQVRLRATIGASGVATVVAADTSPGLDLDLVGADSGIYDLSFPSCRKVACIHIDVWPDAAATITEHRKVSVDQDNTSASSGNIRFHCAKFDGTENDAVSPVSGSEIHADFIIDLG